MKIYVIVSCEPYAEDFSVVGACLDKSEADAKAAEMPDRDVLEFECEAPPIYFVRRWRRYEGEDVLDMGMLTTDKVKADAYCAAHPGFTAIETEDGYEEPSM